MLIEMHSHVIRNVDDGPQDNTHMFALLAQAASQGTRHLICTSHITPGYKPFPNTEYLTGLQEATAWCVQNAPTLKLHIGSEILYTESTSRLLDEGYVPSLDQTMTVLVEFLPTASEKEIRNALQDLGTHGYTTVLAHVERYAHLHSLSTMASLKQEYGCYYQMNSRTVLSQKDFLHRSLWTKKLLDHHLIDFVSSDAHGAHTRPMCLNEAHEYLASHYSKQEADALCGNNIHALLKLEDIE